MRSTPLNPQCKPPILAPLAPHAADALHPPCAPRLASLLEEGRAVAPAPGHIQTAPAARPCAAHHALVPMLTLRSSSRACSSRSVSSPLRRRSSASDPATAAMWRIVALRSRSSADLGDSEASHLACSNAAMVG